MPPVSATLPFWGGEDGAAWVYEEELNPWNTIYIDDELFPSADNPVIVTQVKAAVSYNVDKRKRQNKNGNRKVVKGYKAAPISFTFLILTEGQYRDYKAVIPSIHPKYNADNRKGHRIYYPDLDDVDIHFIYIDKIETPEWSSEWGIRQYTISGEEVYEDDKDATKKVKADKKPDPNAGGAAIDPDFISDDGPTGLPPKK